MNKNDQHEFALYYSELKQTKELTFLDHDLVSRIGSVLRLKSGESVILFNQHYHALFLLKEVSHKKVSGTLGQLQINTQYEPHITLLLPVLKREALENAVYGAVESGVSEIQLVLTQKVQRKWQPKDLERLNRIIIAAAEQSKCFAAASLYEPIQLEAALEKYQHQKLYFADPAGIELQKVENDCSVLIGPEGDLTESEKEQLKKYNPQFFKLTPTILRAQLAAVVSVAIIRSI